MADRATARAAKSELRALLRGAPHVNGIGLSHQGSEWNLKVNLDIDDKESRDAIPSLMNGVPVVIEVVGPVQSLGD